MRLINECDLLINIYNVLIYFPLICNTCGSVVVMINQKELNADQTEEAMLQIMSSSKNGTKAKRATAAGAKNGSFSPAHSHFSAPK